jgi:hypothetical protein
VRYNAVRHGGPAGSDARRCPTPATVHDRFFCSLLASTFPNREYMHAAQHEREAREGRRGG